MRWRVVDRAAQILDLHPPRRAREPSVPTSPGMPPGPGKQECLRHVFQGVLVDPESQLDPYCAGPAPGAESLVSVVVTTSVSRWRSVNSLFTAGRSAFSAASRLAFCTASK